jgi:nucleotide-binding universal stress UspA family protein
MKILLTHDGSEMADVAVPRVRALAHLVGPATEVVGLCITSSHAGAGSTELVEAERSLDRVQRALRAEGVEHVTATVLAGSAGPLIVETAEQLDCDLIAMSTSGHSGSKQFLGSVADYVARHSQHIPVMLCRPELVGSPHFKKLLLPLDGSDASANALAEAQQLASMTGAEIVLLRLIDTVEQIRSMRTPAGYELGADVAAEQALGQIIAAERDSAHRELDADAARLRDAGLTAVDVVITPGTPGETIVETAAQLGCDLIVMSSIGRGWREGARVLGSVADHVLQHVGHAAVLVVPPADGSARSEAA